MTRVLVGSNDVENETKQTNGKEIQRTAELLRKIRRDENKTALSRTRTQVPEQKHDAKDEDKKKKNKRLRSLWLGGDVRGVMGRGARDRRRK